MAAVPAEVIVDDRIATVLATVPAGHVGVRTQYRQLLDLLGRTPPGLALPDAAEARLDELEAELSVDERAELLRALPGSLRHPALILRLANQAPGVAASAVFAARLDDWQWSALALELPLAARGYLRQRRDIGPRTAAVLTQMGIGDLGLPAPTDVGGETAPPPPAPAEGAAGIAAIVRRIEAFRRSRQAEARQADEGRLGYEAAPPLPFADLAGSTAALPDDIAFSSDLSGRIVSAQPPFAAMLTGFRLGQAHPDAVARCDSGSAAAFARRGPVRGGRISFIGAPAISGKWRIDAAPRFAKSDGSFLGYSGVLRRPPAGSAANADEGPADRLRQLLHELRTPVNAIQGFAELIQQQLFGPTPHQYRSLSASIAADSAAILAGFEEIDRLVRLETGQAELASGSCEIGALVDRLLRQVEPALTKREAAITFDGGEDQVTVALADSEAERLLWRVLTHLAAHVGQGERLSLDLSDSGDEAGLRLDLPAALAQLDDDALFAVTPADEGRALGLLGGGFPLRLARAEAEAESGGITRVGSRLLIRLPGLTPRGSSHSPVRSPLSERAGER